MLFTTPILDNPNWADENLLGAASGWMNATAFLAATGADRVRLVSNRAFNIITTFNAQPWATLMGLQVYATVYGTRATRTATGTRSADREPEHCRHDRLRRLDRQGLRRLVDDPNIVRFMPPAAGRVGTLATAPAGSAPATRSASRLLHLAASAGGLMNPASVGVWAMRASAFDLNPTSGGWPGIGFRLSGSGQFLGFDDRRRHDHRADEHRRRPLPDVHRRAHRRALRLQRVEADRRRRRHDEV